MNEFDASCEAIAKRDLSAIGFKRWKSLMKKIERVERDRNYYNYQLSVIAKESNDLLSKMQQLWAMERRK